MQFKMRMLISHGYIVVITLTHCEVRRLLNGGNSSINVLFMHKHINIATRAHLRCWIKMAKSRAFKRNVRYLLLTQC